MPLGRGVWRGLRPPQESRGVWGAARPPMFVVAKKNIKLILSRVVSRRLAPTSHDLRYCTITVINTGKENRAWYGLKARRAATINV